MLTCIGLLFYIFYFYAYENNQNQFSAFNFTLITGNQMFVISDVM